MYMCITPAQVPPCRRCRRTESRGHPALNPTYSPERCNSRVTEPHFAAHALFSIKVVLLGLLKITTSAKNVYEIFVNSRFLS